MIAHLLQLQRHKTGTFVRRQSTDVPLSVPGTIWPLLLHRVEVLRVLGYLTEEKRLKIGEIGLYVVVIVGLFCDVLC